MTDILPPVGETSQRPGQAPTTSPVPPRTHRSTPLVRRTLGGLAGCGGHPPDAACWLVLFPAGTVEAGPVAIAGLSQGHKTELLSDIIFVLILMELYRLMIYYLREHRISVALTVEVALVSILREVMLKGAYGFEWLRLVGLVCCWASSAGSWPWSDISKRPGRDPNYDLDFKAAGICERLPTGARSRSTVAVLGVGISMMIRLDRGCPGVGSPQGDPTHRGECRLNPSSGRMTPDGLRSAEAGRSPSGWPARSWTHWHRRSPCWTSRGRSWPSMSRGGSSPAPTVRTISAVSAGVNYLRICDEARGEGAGVREQPSQPASATYWPGGERRSSWNTRVTPRTGCTGSSARQVSRLRWDRAGPSCCLARGSNRAEAVPRTSSGGSTSS